MPARGEKAGILGAYPFAFCVLRNDTEVVGSGREDQGVWGTAYVSHDSAGNL